MKKLFTLALGLMLSVAMFAADHRPTVTVKSAKRYEIVIDGKRFMSNGNTINISSLSNGRHSVQVFEVNPGFFSRTKRLVASSSFRLRNNDVRIAIDRFGNMQIKESKFGRDWDDRRDNDRDYGRGRDRDHDRDRY